MTDTFAAWALEEIDERALVVYIVDGLGSAGRALSHIEMSAADNLDVCDRLVAKASTESKNVLDVALDEGIDVSCALAAMIVMGALMRWRDGGSSAFIQMANFLRLAWPEVAGRTGTFEQQLLDAVLEAGSGLARLEADSKLVPASATQAAEGFYRLALVLDSAGHLESAHACAQTSTNFAVMLEPTRAEPPSELALSLARRTSSEAAYAVAAARRAQVLGHIARDDPTRRLEAFDAFEVALACVPDGGETRGVLLPMLRSWLSRESYLEPLLPMLWMVLPPDERPALPVEPKGIALALAPIWEGSVQEWFNRLDYIRALSINKENARLALDLGPISHAAKATWATWSIEHPNLRRAVPHHNSFEREEAVDDLLLTLNHEVSHVFSMVGFVGTASLAMRWAFFELELVLWSFIGTGVGQEMLRTQAPAPLVEPDVLALAEAEQALEVERKIQILEDAWAPWFEGIAVFGELADPQLHVEAHSPVFPVIYNLFDRPLAKKAQESGASVEEVAQQALSAAENLYAAALGRSGAYRLRTYLDQYHRKYLAGYLAVRSVVSAWRAALGYPLGGAEAFMILLHVTRFSGTEPLPDLGLPVDAFKEAVMAKHVEWLTAIAGISRDDLERVLRAIRIEPRLEVGVRWHRGHLEEPLLVQEMAQIELEARDRVVELARQSLASLRGDRAPLKRVPDADDGCRRLLQATAEVLAEASATPRLFKADTLGALGARLLILPLGRAACPFWLLVEQRLLACLVRTRERDREHGEPSYDLLAFTLEEQAFSDICERVRRGRIGRMTVTRVADLNEGPGRGFGRNFLAFQYEDWMHIQPRGLLFGADYVDPEIAVDIRARLAPGATLATYDRLTADDHPCALRTERWIARNEWLVQIKGVEIDVRPWARRVRELAHDVLSRGGPDEWRRFALPVLRFVLGDKCDVARLADRGLDALGEQDPAAVTEFVRLLYASAQKPAGTSPAIDRITRTVSEHVGPLLEITSNGWDVVPPAPKEGRIL